MSMGEYLTLKQISEKYRAFSLRYLRTLLLNRHQNGFSDCVISLSANRLLIDESKFLSWIDQHREVSE